MIAGERFGRAGARRVHLDGAGPGLIGTNPVTAQEPPIARRDILAWLVLSIVHSNGPRRAHRRSTWIP